jgi:AAA family ATP:ADP antiporter
MLKETITNIHKEFISLSPKERRPIILVALNLFAVLFSYPMIRSASTAIFVDYYGAKNTPWVWILSVVALAISVSLFNKWQKKRSVFFLYSNISILTSVVFLVCNILYLLKINIVAFPYYVWKEVYIILLVHLSIGYLNSKVEYRVAKLTYGPLGALGSLGGVLGGLLTSSTITFVNANFGKGLGLIAIGLVGTLIIFLTTFLFASAKGDYIHKKEETTETPLASIVSVKKYVFLMASIVAISQFVINLANYKFNLGLEEFVSGAEGKGEFLGKVYSGINLISFSFQVIFIPILLKLVKVRVIHVSIPLLFGCLFLMTFFFSGSFLPVAMLFIVYKGLDYSLFSTAKEMLYFPLSQVQKFGAKYVVDMIVYRASKMLISAILLFIAAPFLVDSILGICLIIWIVLTVLLFAERNTFKA